MREIAEATRQIGNMELTEMVAALMGAKDAVPYNAFIEACDDSGEFFAECIHKCLDGVGTDDVCLIRIIVSRSEVSERESMIMSN